MVKLPDPVLEERDGFVIVRDDILPGGTKRRVAGVLLNGAEEFVYASPAYGYAQIALAYACKDADKRATIFTAKRKVLAPRSLQAKEQGATIVFVPTGYLTNVQAKARSYAEVSGACLLPFGFDHPDVVVALADLALSLPVKPYEVWTVAGSGTLTRALQQAWPLAQFYAVKIGKEPHAGRAFLFHAPELFEQAAKVNPPFPSCPQYDAKAWRFVKQHASPGALFWNVGR